MLLAIETSSLVSSVALLHDDTLRAELTIQARLTCKRKIDRNRVDPSGVGQGVVAWDVEVSNQHGELVASYDILTLVAKRG